VTGSRNGREYVPPRGRETLWHPLVPLLGQAVVRDRRHSGETNRWRATPSGLANPPERIMARLAEKTDLILRTLSAELMVRSVAVSYFGVRHTLKRVPLSVKKPCAPLLWALPKATVPKRCLGENGRIPSRAMPARDRSVTGPGRPARRRKELGRARGAGSAA
jgi:hypothetical protein